jgi:hypothetical protein
MRAMEPPDRIIVVHSCAFCGEAVPEGPNRAILHVSMVPEKGGARFFCHVACLEQRLHLRAKEVIQRG